MSLFGKKLHYKLDSGNNVNWHFDVDIELREWFFYIVDVMQLVPAENLDEADFTLIVFPWGKETGHLLEKRSKDWTIFKFSDVYRIWVDTLKQQIFLELNKKYLYQYQTKYIGFINALRFIYKFYVYDNGGIIHAAAAAIADNAVLIAGEGGAGKTTLYNKLPDSWIPFCDDTSFVIEKNNGYYVHPVPTWSTLIWNDKKTGYNSLKLNALLKGIFFIEHSECFGIEELNKTCSMIKIFESKFQAWNNFLYYMNRNFRTDFIDKLMNNSRRMTEHVPCFILKVNINSQPWEDIQKLLQL